MTVGANAKTYEELSQFYDVREFLHQSHRKQLALLDRFLLELRRGRLAQNTVDLSNDKNNFFLSHDRRVVTHRTVDLLRHMIGSTKWKSPAQLLSLLRGLGRELQAAGGSREPAIGNVVRRIMAVVREEAASAVPTEPTDSSNKSTPGGRLSLQSLLWALPQHVRSSRSLPPKGSGDHQRQESFADTDFEAEYPASYFAERSDLKSSVMEASEYQIVFGFRYIEGHSMLIIHSYFY